MVRDRVKFLYMLDTCTGDWPWMGKCASKITDQIQMPIANLSNGMKCSVIWKFVFISCMELLISVLTMPSR